MDKEKEVELFSTIDPLGRNVFLTENRYYGHIISSDNNHQAHPEFTPDEVKKTIENPVVIYESTLPNSDVFFGKTSKQYPELYIKVAVSIYETENIGEVSTAHLSKHIAGKIVPVEEGGLKYVKSQL